MASFNDPYVVGQLVGAAFGAGAVGYFIGRMVFPQRRSAGVARLMEAAGVDDDAGAGGKKPGFRPPPILLALGMALVGVAVVAGQIAREGFSASALPELRAGLVHGCVETCTKGGGPANACEQVCTCMKTDIEAGFHSERELAAWYSAAAKSDEAALQKLFAVRAACVERFQQGAQQVDQPNP